MSEVEHIEAKSKQKAGKAEICNKIAYCIHPESIAISQDFLGVSIRSLKYNYDLRLVRNKDGFLKWVQVQANKELVILRREQVRSALQCAFAEFEEAEKTLTSKDFDTIITIVEDKAPHMDALATGLGKEKLILDEENEIKDVRFLSEEGFCYKKLNFDPDPFAPSTLWETDILPRINHNRELFMAWIGSLFDYKSNKKKYVWMKGGTDSGKSAIATFLMDLFGNAAMTCMSETVNSDWFNVSLLGKRVCAITEAQPHIVASEKWKALTGEVYFNIQQKYKDDRVEKINTKYILFSNHQPKVGKGRENSNRLIYTVIDPLNEENLLEEHVVKNLLFEGAPWFIYHCIEEYKKNPTLYLSYDKYVEMIQEEDLKDEDFAKHFVLDEKAFVTSRELDIILQDRNKAYKDEFKHWLVDTKGVIFKHTRMNGIMTRHFLGIRKK